MDLRLNTGYLQILRMAMPISLALLVPQVNFITNNIFLGGLGERELASAGITGVYYLIFAVIGNGLSNGLQVLIARRAGQNQPKEIGVFFYHGVWIAVLVAVLGIVITYAFAPLILSSTLHNAEVVEEATSFLLIRIWGLPLLYLYIMRNALLVGTNQTRLLVWGALAETFTNIILDYTLIYGHFGAPALGFNGAAYASIAAEGMGLFVIYVIIHSKGIHRRFSLFGQLRFQASVFRVILTRSSPLVLQFAISIISWEFFYILIEHHGQRALAISNTMRNVFGLFGIFGWSFAATTNTMVSNIIGQDRREEVLGLIGKVARMSFGIALVACILLNIFPERVLMVYSQSAEFVSEGIPVVRVASLALVFMSFGTVWLNGVTGTGKTTVNLWIEVTAIVAYSVYVYIVLEYLFLPITWGWASEWLYWLMMFALSYAYLKSGRWKSEVI